MRFDETFIVARPPAEVFDYVTDPSNLAAWQTANRSVEQLTDGPPGPGSRFRERRKPPASREFVQITEFVIFDRPRLLKVHVVEGPVPVHGTWAFAPEGGGTRVTFTAEGELRGVRGAEGGRLRGLLGRRLRLPGDTRPRARPCPSRPGRRSA